jgi:hypothetical protein
MEAALDLAVWNGRTEIAARLMPLAEANFRPPKPGTIGLLYTCHVLVLMLTLLQGLSSPTGHAFWLWPSKRGK